MFTFTLTKEQLDIVWTALNKVPMPRELTDLTVAAIQKQYLEQQENKENVTDVKDNVE